jgi:hypothetical protein
MSTCPACAFEAARSAAVDAKAKVKTFIRIFLPTFARFWRRDFGCSQSGSLLFFLRFHRLP